MKEQKEEKLTLYSVWDENPWTGEITNKVEIAASSRSEAKEFWLLEFKPDLEPDIREAFKLGLRVKYIGGYKDETKFQRSPQLLLPCPPARCLWQCPQHIKCNSEFSELEVEDASSCPACGDIGAPALISDDVAVRINWHELRILSIWAENWAKKIQQDDPKRNSGSLLTVMSIAERLQRQHPDKTKLTLFSEIRELREKLPEILPGSRLETNIDDDSALGLN